MGNHQTARASSLNNLHPRQLIVDQGVGTGEQSYRGMITRVDPRTMTLEEQYGHILLCCDQLLAALHAGSSSDQIGQIRMQLAGMLHANLAAEEIQLNGPIRRLAPADRPREFAKLSEEAAYLRRLYSEHVGRWTLLSIDTDPVSYANSASELVREVKAHLTRKRALLPEWRQVQGTRL